MRRNFQTQILITLGKIYTRKAPDSESNSTLPTSVCTSIQSHTNSLETVTLCRHSCLGLPHTNTFQPSYFGNCS